jgi:short-subunit dehydrogenase
MRTSLKTSISENWLLGKRVLVTGATSGIGRSLVLLLVDKGSTVLAHGRSRARLQSLVKTLGGKGVETVLGDLSRESGLKSLESAIVSFAPDVVVLNAGYNCRKEYASGWKDSEITEMLMVNLVSAIRCVRTFSQLPKRDEARRLALILSTSCHFPRPQMSLYVACKTGLMGFGRCLQQEAHELGVRTTLFYPGRTNSGFRQASVAGYMDSDSVARAILSTLTLPPDLVPHEFTFRPEIDVTL